MEGKTIAAFRSSRPSYTITLSAALDGMGTYQYYHQRLISGAVYGAPGRRDRWAYLDRAACVPTPIYVPVYLAEGFPGGNTQ
jgi:hypothetical protein